ncbi:hypothetical protein TruAng_004919 [Truncatella angustata]|nr:hypothetical protein TruAng_004919 [Truncatella angustata]
MNRTTPIENLTILARRFHGLRPIIKEDYVYKPYCPPEADWSSAQPLTELKGRVNKLRIVGFNGATGQKLIAALFPNVDCERSDVLWYHGARAGISKVWPFLPGQASIHRDATYPSKEAQSPQSSTSKTALQASENTDSDSRMGKVKDALGEQKGRSFTLDNEADLTQKYQERRQRNRELSAKPDDEMTPFMKSEALMPLNSGMARFGSRKQTHRRSKARIEDEGTLLLPKGKDSGKEVTHKEVTPRRSLSDGFILTLRRQASKASLTAVTHMNVKDNVLEGSYLQVEDTSGEGSSVRSTMGISKAPMRVDGSAETDDGTAADDSKRSSEVSQTSLHSKRSFRWSEEKAREILRVSKGSLRSFKTAGKSKSMPVSESSPREPEEPIVVQKRASAKELRKKKSFVDFLWGSSRTGVSGRGK